MLGCQSPLTQAQADSAKLFWYRRCLMFVADAGVSKQPGLRGEDCRSFLASMCRVQDSCDHDIRC